MSILNRQIKTARGVAEPTITLEALQTVSLDDKEIKKGDTFEVTRKEAKRVLTEHSHLFRVFL